MQFRFGLATKEACIIHQNHWYSMAKTPGASVQMLLQRWSTRTVTNAQRILRRQYRRDSKVDDPGLCVPQKTPPRGYFTAIPGVFSSKIAKKYLKWFFRMSQKSDLKFVRFLKSLKISDFLSWNTHWIIWPGKICRALPDFSRKVEDFLGFGKNHPRFWNCVLIICLLFAFQSVWLSKKTKNPGLYERSCHNAYQVLLWLSRSLIFLNFL